MYIEVTGEPISPETVISQIKTPGSGCVVTYIGLIRAHSQGKWVISVAYEDSKGTAETTLRAIADEIKDKWPVENVAICHRTGKLKVGDINFVAAVASAHREAGFAACQYAVDRFKQTIPTHKTETYREHQR